MAAPHVVRSVRVALAWVLVLVLIVSAAWAWHWFQHARVESVAALVGDLETLVGSTPDSASHAMLVAKLDEVGIRYRDVDMQGGGHLVRLYQERLLRIAGTAADPDFSGSATVVEAAVRLRSIVTGSW
jgi:hypothetical protein